MLLLVKPVLSGQEFLLLIALRHNSFLILYLTVSFIYLCITLNYQQVTLNIYYLPCPLHLDQKYKLWNLSYFFSIRLQIMPQYKIEQFQISYNLVKKISFFKKCRYKYWILSSLVVSKYSFPSSPQVHFKVFILCKQKECKCFHQEKYRDYLFGK